LHTSAIIINKIDCTNQLFMSDIYAIISDI
jgi:hypothetical protein